MKIGSYVKYIGDEDGDTTSLHLTVGNYYEIVELEINMSFSYVNDIGVTFTVYFYEWDEWEV